MFERKEYDFYRITVAKDRISIKGQIDAPHNFAWLVEALNVCIPIEMPSMRGCIWLHNPYLNLSNSTRSILESIQLRDNFWRVL